MKFESCGTIRGPLERWALVARNKPRGVFLPVKHLHFIKDKKGVKVSARIGKLSAAELKRLIAFFKHL